MRVYARTTFHPDLIAGPIIGRDAELDAIQHALDGLDGGAPAWLAVEGEPGIGKTRLVAELRARADDAGHVVLGGTAAEFERDMPFSVWADALDAYVASQELAERDGWDPGLGDELAGILPGLRRGGAGDPTIADERYRAHRAVRRLLELLAADGPLVVVLDDVQWSDHASVELIAALARRPPAGPVLLALAFRRGQAPERLDAALTGAGVPRLRLMPLTEDEAARLLPDMAPEAVAGLYRHGGGNPFYLEQLARAGPGADVSAADEAPADNGDLAAAVPSAVMASLADELTALPSESRALLAAAAIAGEPFEADVAAAIAHHTPAVGLAALDELLALDLVRPTEVPRRFVFRHPLVRRAVYDAIGGGSKLAAHARAAAVLEARGAPATEAAHHVEISAAQGDERAIALLRDAGAATAARAPEAAARWLTAALRLLPAGDAERQVDVRVALAAAQRSAGDLDRCGATLLEAVALLDPADVQRRVELIARCAAVEHWLGRHDAAHQRLTRAWDELPDQATPAAVGLQIELAVDGLYELDFPQTVAMGRAALDGARALGDRVLLAGAASVLALGESAGGEIAAAREHHAEAVAEVDRLTDAELAPRLEALYHLGWTENYLERYDAAVAHADRGIAIARATGDGRLLVPMMLVKGFPFELQGRLAEAVEVAATAVEVARLSGNPHYLFWALFELGWAHYFAGDLDAAIAAGEESARVGDRLSGATMPSAGGGPGWMLACARFEAGDAARAKAEMDALGSAQLEHKIPVERCFDWEIMALVDLALGDIDGASRNAARAERAAEALGLMLPATLAARTRAAVLLAEGDAAGAAAACETSVRCGDAAAIRLQAAFSRALLGTARAAEGDRKAAVKAWREAEHALDACGSIRVRDEVRRALRKLGARVEPRGPASAGDSGMTALTARELEIAELVCERHTNREIAGRLFLSDKTIESHLRNIFIKLGVSSRVEVARTVERER